MVNVPTAVWIDERGRIVRPNEVAFVDDRFKSFTGMDSAPYVDAIRDWAANGARSVYALSEEPAARLKPPGDDRAKADAEFALAEYLYQQKKIADAIPHFKKRNAWRRTTGTTNARPGLSRMPSATTAPTSRKKSTSSTASLTTNRASCRERRSQGSSLTMKNVAI
jgi:hypothetical protein